MSNEDNRFSRRMGRYARVGTNVGGVAARIAVQRLVRNEGGDERSAAQLAEALGGLKGPLMKVAQFISTIPEAVPEEYAAELSKLQSSAPPMGWGFVKRRMAAELGPDWRTRFADFERESVASASLGQVHRAVAHDGSRLACKLQYPDMESAVEADLTQLRVIFSIHKRMSRAVDTSEMLSEIAARLREELDYKREAAHLQLYGAIFDGDPLVTVPHVYPELSSKRLLSMQWLDGAPLMTYKSADQEARDTIARSLFRAWWYPFSHYGVIHGDPHLGNYTIPTDANGRPTGLNLLDYGCIRIFPSRFVQGVIDLYHGLERGDRDLVVHAYETWGFKGLTSELVDVLSIWAKFIYGPLLDDRERTIAEGISPGAYGRKEAFTVHSALKEKGPVKIPREFVFMDRAAIGLGGVFLHLGARLNYYRIFNEMIENYSQAKVEDRQRSAFERVGLQHALAG